MANTYQGSCHCGAVRFEVTMPAPDKAYACNCSICSRAGWLVTMVGADALADYQFGKKTIHHLFCRTCGVRSFSRGTDQGKEVYAVNLRCLAGLEVAKLPVETYDGASL